MDFGNSDKMGWPILGTFVGSVALTAAEQHMPEPVAWLVNTVVILGIGALVCRYKRSRAVWVCFWVLAAVCIVEPFLDLAGLLSSFASPVLWVFVWLEVGAWYWLLRFPRVLPAAAPQVSHVIHHHVVHGAFGQDVGVPAGKIFADELPEEVIRGAVPGTVEPPAARRAISAAPVRLGRMAEALKSYVRR